MRKTLVTTYYKDDWNTVGNVISNTATRKSFEELHVMALEKDIEMFRCSIKWYDIKKGVFTKGWGFRNGTWKKFEKDIKPDFVYDKVAGARDHEIFEIKKELARQTKVFNTPLFRSILNDKFSQIVLFGEFMPVTLLVNNKKECTLALEKIESEKIVVKPLHGSGGFGIIIDEKKNISTEKLDFPVIIQAFIKSTKGIPGFHNEKCVADLRMVFLNHELVYSLSRIAKEDSLFTNFHQGAHAVIVPKEKIPESALKIAEKIIKKLSIFPEALYSIDFMFSDDGEAFVIELNTTPGIDLLREFGTKELWKNYANKFFSLVN